MISIQIVLILAILTLAEAGSLATSNAPLVRPPTVLSVTECVVRIEQPSWRWTITMTTLQHVL